MIPGRTAVSELIGGLAERSGRGATVLEAGCGRLAHFAYPDSMRIVGLDISDIQLERNDYVHETILGDVQTHAMDREFDVVVSVYVLEHVADPGAALGNMLKWTRPGGLLVIAVPNLWSLKGMVTRITPFWFHHLAYRLILRRKYEIFPTTMKGPIAPGAMRRRFAGHEILHEAWGEETVAPPFGIFYRGLNAAGRVLSLGRWRPERANYLVVVRKAAG